MIRLRGITKYYANAFIKTFVLRNIDLDVCEGEFLTIMGPSGAGKSTLRKNPEAGKRRKNHPQGT